MYIFDVAFFVCRGLIVIERSIGETLEVEKLPEPVYSFKTSNKQEGTRC